MVFMTNSPCIDAGASNAAPASDRDGVPRPLDGDTNSVAVADKLAFTSSFIRPPTPMPTGCPTPGK
jgi:hypothetical protein